MKTIKNIAIALLVVVLMGCVMVLFGESLPPTPDEPKWSINEGTTWIVAASVVGIAALFSLIALVNKPKGTV